MIVAVCTGGTGGHIFPAVALVEEFERRHHVAMLITDGRGAVYCDNIKNKEILETVRFSKKWFCTAVIRMLKTFFHFLAKWKRERPDVIIGFGGLFTIVPIFVAWIYGIKIILYEQNAVIGRANRCLVNFADLKLSTFSIGYGWKIQLPPVRREFLKKFTYKLKDKIKVLIIGGSQGARSFSSMIPMAMSRLSERERTELEIVQQYSFGKVEELKKQYDTLGIKSTVEEFIYNVADYMSDCQLVICRAGASTLAELAAAGRPAILIPYPHSQDNHQYLNAKRYVDRGVAWMIEENFYASEKLQKTIRQILKDKKLLKQRAENMYNSSLKSASGDFVRLVENFLENQR